MFSLSNQYELSKHIRTVADTTDPSDSYTREKYSRMNFELHITRRWEWWLCTSAVAALHTLRAYPPLLFPPCGVDKHVVLTILVWMYACVANMPRL